jgi:hypothetical protein
MSGRGFSVCNPAQKQKKGYRVKTMANKRKPEVDGVETVDNTDLDLDVILSEIGNEGSIIVSRKEPDWCKGHIRTMQINAGEPVSMDTIAAKFGGEKLYFRIYGPKGLVARRTIDVCAPPRNGYGIELVLGPRGNVIPITQMESEQARFMQKNPSGALPAGAYAPPALPPPPAAPAIDNSIIQMMRAQQDQTNALLNMFLTRIGALETMLQRQAPAGAPQAPAYDPLGQLQNTVTVIGQLDKIKRSMIDDRPPAADEGDGIYTQIISKFLELAVDKQKAAAAGALPAPPQYALPQYQSPIPPGALGALSGSAGAGAFTAPPPPAGSPPPPPPVAAGKIDLTTVPNDDLVMAIFQRLPDLSDEDRLRYAEQLLGQPIELDDTDDTDDTDEPPPKN